MFSGVLIHSADAQSTNGVTVLNCAVDRKLDSQRNYPQSHLDRYKPSVIVRMSGSGAMLSRCSVSPSSGAETCDDYSVDRVDHEENVGITKFYVTDSHFDVQVFSDLSFVENNGRGTISFGQCVKAQ